jgi:hypothetical protein
MSRVLESAPPVAASQTWQAPECPLAIEWSVEVMEEIRQAAMEALFSVPHGGAEIGGVLWGTRSARRVRILAARPLECEHALGPTFTLSGKDHARLAGLLGAGCGEPGAQAWEPLGWYHSHTRSEIFLSARDVEIHNRYFSEAWQVALVVRPHAMQPLRAGFFFREANGSMHTGFSFREFLVEPSVLQQTLRQTPGPMTAPAEAMPVASPAIPTNPLPARKRSRRWHFWIAIVLGMATGLFAFKYDWTRLLAVPPASVSLMAYDLNGQLQIRWDWEAGPVRSAESGTLEITDGATHTAIALEKQRVQGGTVSYVRIGPRVDLHLALREPGGKVCEGFTSFVGHAVAKHR